HRDVRELPRQRDPASAVLSVRHQLRQDDRAGAQRAAAVPVRAVQRAESGDLRRTAVREQSDQLAVRIDRSYRRPAVELPGLRAARVKAAVLRFAAPGGKYEFGSRKSAARSLVSSFCLRPFAFLLRPSSSPLLRHRPPGRQNTWTDLTPSLQQLLE